MLIVWACVAVAIFKDAANHQMPPMLWAILVFLFGLLGLGGYFIARHVHDKKAHPPVVQA